MSSYRGGVLTGTDRETGDRLRPVLIGLAVVFATLVSAIRFGSVGVVVGGMLVGAWLVVAPIFVLALAQVLFAALLPADASLSTIVIVETPLALLFLAAVLDIQAPLRSLVVGVVTLTALGGLVGAGIARMDAFWQVAFLLGCVVTVASYGLHRYTVVTLEGPHGP